MQVQARVARDHPNCYLEVMSSPNGKAPSSPNRPSVRVRRPGSTARSSKVKFGAVTITGAKPRAATIKINVARSSEALARVAKRLARPGVNLPAKKDVPQYWAAEGEPGVFVRKLNGLINRGRVVEGQFQVID